jgi:hypothetical protein
VQKRDRNRRQALRILHFTIELNYLPPPDRA